MAGKSTFLDVPILRMLDVALIHVHASTLAYQKDEGTAQNELITVVLKLPSRTHLGAERFKTLGWLKVADRGAMLRFRLGQGILINSAPNHFKGYFLKELATPTTTIPELKRLQCDF